MAQQLDLGVGDVHVAGPVKAQKTMAADMTTAQRKKLPNSAFAGPDRSFPVHNKAHADNAAARLEQQKGSMSPATYARIKSKIKAAQRRFGEKPKTAASSRLRGNGRGLRMSITAPDGTQTVVRHMAAYRDDTDSLILSLPLDKASALAAGDADKRVWVQIGRAGRWLGHRQGPFELNSQIFDALCRNFKSQGVGRLQYDFEHASEMRPTDGSIPMVGAPAQGWVYDLKHDGKNLYALTEWKNLAREYIANDQYSGVSPAISWKNKDRVTAQDIGPMLTSVALTNKPFITGMRAPEATAASAAGGEQASAAYTLLTLEGAEPEATYTLASGYCYSANEYMPRIRSALSMPELCTAQQCSEALDALRGHFDAAGGDPSGMHQGLQLSRYLMPLRDLAGAGMGSTWDDVFDLIGELIQAAIGEDDDEDDDEGGGGIEASAAAETPPTLATITAQENTMVEPQIQTPAVQTAATAGGDTTLASMLSSAQTEVQTLSAQLNAQRGELDEVKRENVTLLSWKTERLAKDTAARVTSAIATYGEKRGIKETDRDWLTTLCTNTPEAFDKAYPPVSADQQHLLANHTGGGRNGTAGGEARAGDQPVVPGELPVMTLSSMADAIAKQDGCTLAIAQVRAEKIMADAQAKARKTAAAPAR